MDYRFDGRVAIVTGAGRGIGLAHAQLLAKHGASVVLNDLGGTKEGEGADPEPAQTAVDEIVANGGIAVADTNDVSTVEGCEAMVAAAVKEFGKVDIVVNNAGISWWGSFPDVEPENLERTWRVHVGGSWHTTRAAWPYMQEQGYGRVVMTTSTGMFGLPDNLSYATAKGAVIGLTRSLAINCAPDGIKVNCLAPNAATRRGYQKDISIFKMAAANPGGAPPPPMPTDWVSPLLAYMCHESFQETGEIYVGGMRRFAKLFIGATEGYVVPGEGDIPISEVADHWAEINDESGYYVPKSLQEWSARYSSHRRQAAG
jgi:NAD(P)-dependent dehydrogenase (short-subunit alcohol dehydrogenase family)